MSQKPKVYFTKTITPEKVLEMYKILNVKLPGNIGVKVHSGEKGNQNFIRPDFIKPLVDYVDGTIIETNTAGGNSIPGERTSTEKHKKLLEFHEWTKYFKKVEILDDEPPDEEVKIPNGLILKKNYLGRHTKKYDSILVISHFKGHGFGGFGGALKQLSIGFSSAVGKTYVHSAGESLDPETVLQHICGDKEFMESMADAASVIVDRYKGKMAFVTLMKNISIDCDCDGHARPPCMKDIGILSSIDPVAIDKACLDLIYNSKDPGKEKLIERIEKKLGPHTIESAIKLGYGKNEYELINVD